VKEKNQEAENRKSVVFLLGAGASIPGGFPSTSELTNYVLSGEGVKWCSGGYHPFRSTEPDTKVNCITEYLSIVKKEIDSYYEKKPERSANYEDLYYVTSQIAESELGDTDNPVVQQFIEKLSPQIDALLPRYPADKFVLPEQDLNHQASYYIRDVVWHRLKKKAESECHLSWLAEACDDLTVSPVTIATLNHDTSLETFLRNRGIEPYDGFGDPSPKVRYWDWKPGANNKRNHVTLLKLHGSINWFRLCPEGGIGYDDRIGLIPADVHFDRTVDENGYRQAALDSRPLLLIGTFNKLYSYASGELFDLHHMFREALRGSERLVVAGYGFGDKGINNHIVDWFFSSKKNRITVVHAQPEKLMRNARGAIKRLKGNPMLSFVKKKIEAVTWNEVKKHEEKTHRGSASPGSD